MPKTLSFKNGTEAGLRELLQSLLESGKVRGVFTLMPAGKSGGVAYSLITRPEALKDAMPLFPAMPVDAAKVLSRLTLIEPAAEPIAAVVRPCELRALTELIKRNQGSRDNLLLISSTCGGVYPLKMLAESDIKEKLPQYWDEVKKGGIPQDIRSACAACEHFVPFNADLTVALVGNQAMDKQCIVSANTERGEQAVEGMAAEAAEAETGAKAIEGLRQQRQAKKQELFEKTGIEGFDIKKGFDATKVFEKCLGCQNCSKVCPVCYCRVCFFDSGGDDHDVSYYETKVEKNGYVPVQPAPIFYQLVRLYHVSISCIGCGLCGDVCPVDIPLWAVALKTGEAVQKAFDYIPGKEIEEGIPLTTFRPEEFAGIAE